MYPRESQPSRGFFSEELKQDSTRIKYLVPKGATIISQDTEVKIPTKTVVAENGQRSWKGQKTR